MCVVTVTVDSNVPARKPVFLANRRTIRVVSEHQLLPYLAVIYG